LIATLVTLIVLAAGLLAPNVRSRMRALVRPEPPAPITPIPVVAAPPAASATSRPASTVPPASSATSRPASTAHAAGSPTPAVRKTEQPEAASPTIARSPLAGSPTPTPSPAPSPTPRHVVVGGRIYDAYIPAATKAGQAYQYSCEFDAAWVILQTFGVDADVDDLITIVGVDRSVEPYIEETEEGFVIHGGDITTSFSGDYTQNFLARSSHTAVRKAFEHYGLSTTPVHDRASVETALRNGALVWMKTTVDFKPWRPALWRLPDGRTFRTVLGNDHAVVVIGFNAGGVVIRDVLGPTSTNRQRPYEYEVDWTTFLAAWEAQSFDGLAVARPGA
ncbi:MAG TPA: C39 family peptidase, partial [Herpetosiphonaceae bacterium]|nr:C39 family peptidase [Herpetosiphonaceae bacterium]